MLFLSVIVLVVDEHGVSALEREGQPPILVNPNGPVPRELALQRVQPPAGQIHISRPAGGIEPSKLQPKALGVLWLDASL